MIAMSFFVDGNPIAQPRPRFMVSGKKAIAFVPKEHAVHGWKKAIAAKAAEARPTGWPREAMYEVEFLFVMPRIKKYDNQLPDGRCFDARKPDLDNLAKAVYDAMLNVVWHDDSQVVGHRHRKMFAAKKEKPGLYVSISIAEDLVQF